MQTLSRDSRRVNSSNGQCKAKALRQRIDRSIDVLAQAVDNVRASDTFRAYLDVQARFHRYSWHNAMLILTQRPNASRVAGFQTWKKLGRHVNKGEHGIMIFAPCPWKRDVERDDGKTDEESGVYFKPVHVFDVSQTDGKELPDVSVPVVDSDGSALLRSLEHVATTRGHRVEFIAPDGAFGVAKRDGSIAIDPKNPTGQQAKTLAHELAHQVLHLEKSVCPSDMTRETAELEAEAVAYVVCKHFGLDSGVRSSRYIAVWQGDGKALRASLERIATTARDIIDDASKSSDRKAVA